MATTLKKFRITALLEGISFLVLLGIAMPLKYVYGMPMAVRVAGMLHGVLFLAFVFYLMMVRSEKKWDNRKTFMAFVASLLPFGTFVLDAKVLKKEES
jgi:integral membrane protein